jgi:hypothetical protein
MTKIAKGVVTVKKPCNFLVFGESRNDTAALAELALAIRSDFSTPKCIQKPLILSKDAVARKRATMCEQISKIVAAATVTHDVKVVIAHRDCDKIEPAHLVDSAELKRDMIAHGIKSVVVATPAFELEAWWYQWPDAVAKTRSCWAKLKPRGINIGSIANVKEKLKSDLRVIAPSSCPDYSESDSIAIAGWVRKMGIVNCPVVKSESFEVFKKELLEFDQKKPRRRRKSVLV